MTSNCADCVYHGKLCGDVICDYLSKTGRKRPCEPGDACTVKVGYRRRSYPKRRRKEAPDDGKT